MPQECKMVKVSLITRESNIPIAIAITIAPSGEEAEKHAQKELEPYRKPDLVSRKQSLGLIMYPKFPTTIFLYAQGPGRVK